MAKILNIDSFAKDERSIKLDGVEYPITEMTVDNFIATSIQAQKLEGADLVQQVEATIDMIRRSVPTIPAEVLRGVKLDHLQVITSFIRGDHLVEGVEDTDATVATDEKKVKVKATRAATKK